jgi:hypothetical protein
MIYSTRSRNWNINADRAVSVMSFADYVAVCVQLYCRVSCHCFTLHVSAYMAIFRCVGCYYSHVLEGICFAGFFCILHVVTLCAWLRFCTFPSVGWVKYEVLLIIIYAILTVMVYMFFTYYFYLLTTCKIQKKLKISKCFRLYSVPTMLYKTRDY